jgi:hypothetical protein
MSRFYKAVFYFETGSILFVGFGGRVYAEVRSAHLYTKSLLNFNCVLLMMIYWKAFIVNDLCFIHRVSHSLRSDPPYQALL